ncbi:MAG: two-component regulator propeller domain-containing protein [Candidatus Latescibacterota bacterium]
MRHSIAIIPFFIIIVFASSTYSQNSWQSYDGEYNLGTNWVSSIAVDPDNILYFGTKRGIRRFDGNNWMTFNTNVGLPHSLNNSIRSIAIDSDGTVWAATYYESPAGIQYHGGISKYDGQRWINYTDDDGLIDNNVRSIAVTNDGKVWIGTQGGISCYDGKIWTNFTTANGLCSNWVSLIETTSDGNVWCAHNSPRVISYYNGQVWITYTDVLGLPKHFVSSISSGEDGTTWFSTSGGLGCYDGKEWKRYTVEDGLGINSLESVAVGPDGTVWAGAMSNDRVAVCSYDGKDWHAYSAEDGVARNYVISLAVGKDGTVWAGTGGYGISYLKPESTSISIDTHNAGPFDGFSIIGNFPNPFNVESCIRFAIPYKGVSKLSIFDAVGKLLCTKEFGVLSEGVYNAYWDGRDEYGHNAASGVYFAHLQFDSYAATHPLVLIK